METTGKYSEMEHKIQSLETMVTRLSKTVAEQELLIKHYEEQLLLSRRRQFGSSSEKSPDQLHFENVFNEPEAQTDQSLPEPAYEQITYKRRKRAGKREEDLEGLPAERIDYELPESERSCPECGDIMRDIGVTVRDELEIIPARVIHKEHAVHAYACATCEKNSDHTPVIKAKAPAPLISGSLASPSAVAHIATQKYVNGVPLYRQEKGLEYDNVNLSRQTMANWLVYCSQNYLAAIYSMLTGYLLKETCLHADETTVQVLHEPDRAAQTRSYEWLYRTSGFTEHPVVIYEYKETRNQEHPKAFLKGFEGYLHTDGYQAYHNLPSEITVVGCWAHCRRYWEKLYETVPVSKRNGSNAERGLVYINLLFAYEDEYQDLTPEERHKKRLECSKPVSDEFFDWVSTLQALPKSLFGEAVHYALAQREYLENVYLDGRLELSNNRAERSIKPFVTGRKAWLFANTPNGAEASSIIYSIIETAKENNLHPFQYLKYLLETLPAAKTGDLEALLPWSETLPECCRAPSKKRAEPKKRKTDKGPLHQALIRLRAKFQAENVS
jgi:transposase